jgi:hypothetical protein
MFPMKHELCVFIPEDDILQLIKTLHYALKQYNFHSRALGQDRLCGLVVRVPGA